MLHRTATRRIRCERTFMAIMSRENCRASVDCETFAVVIFRTSRILLYTRIQLVSSFVFYDSCNCIFNKELAAEDDSVVN